VLAVAALVAAVALVAVAMFGKSGAYKVRAVFEHAGQLVPGNQVRVSGQRVGTITDIRLNESAQALISMEIDEDLAPLHEATKATSERRRCPASRTATSRFSRAQTARRGSPTAV
jgi:ABC-type transporter Mla subunit MlaD